MALPLDGVRVLDLTRLLPGNTCAWLLAALGADVVKVEDPGAGDYMREFGMQVQGQGAPHHQVNRAKRSVVLDLKQAAGREAFERLLDTADVLVESFRPGVMQRLGLGPDRILERRPALVYASLSGFGATGSLSDLAAHDINYVALSGLVDRLGTADGPPVVPPIPVADLVGGAILPALGIVSLLLRARASGRGGHLDAAMIEGVTQLPNMVVSDLLAGAAVPGRGRAPHSGGLACYRVYEIADGHVAVGALEPKFWAAMCRALGAEELLQRQHDDDQDALAADLAAALSGLTRAEVRERFEGVDACVTVVASYEEALDSPLAHERGLVRQAPDLPMPVLAPPFVIDGERPPESGPAPRQGEHSRAVLAEAGLSDEEISTLESAGITRQAADT